MKKTKYKNNIHHMANTPICLQSNDSRPIERVMGPPMEYGDNMEYFNDAMFHKHVLKGKIAAALETGDYEYYFASIAVEERAVELARLSDRLSDDELAHFVRKFWVRHGVWRMGNSHALLALVMGERVTRRTLMKDHEQVIFDSLSAEISIYRGCEAGAEELGWSWSLDEAIARRHGLRMSERGEAVMFRGRCFKEDIVSVFQFGGYNELEVVISPERVFDIERRFTRIDSLENELGPRPWEPHVQVGRSGGRQTMRA